MKFIDISSQKNAEYALGLQENNIIKIKINNKNITWEKVGELQVEGVKFAKAFIFENNETIYISNYNDGFITITQKNNLVKK
ncbi:hypothetical protein [Shewanella phaeophyticola]|uniref:Uncharacterized protein n=1 Tax=Shewanella phaeophyticola TaxID=2978345 RepID=A0ABT2NZT5_9GAMM|nr:hypothetical protein [Shewanella sp. KJ10-1]MCT8985906.1 hypothetical protein [Shewanella sp. KJ10-1]